VLRIDNGGEIMKNNTPYTPQHNGVLERKNMTLMDKESFMLSGAGLGK
jgi:hypothetical protein